MDAPGAPTVWRDTGKASTRTIRESDAVFVGTVISAKNAPRFPKERTDSVAQVKVERTYKGKLPAKVTIVGANFMNNFVKIIEEPSLLLLDSF